MAIPTSTTNLKGAGSLLGSAFMIATFGLWVRLVSPMFGNGAQTTGRLTIGALFIAAICLAQHKAWRLTKQQFWYTALMGVASFGLGILFTISANEIKITNSMSLMYAGGIVSALFIGTAFLREKLTGRQLAAMGIALAGLGMYAQDFTALGLGAAAALGAGLCDSICHALRKQLRGADRSVVVMYQYTIAGATAGLCTLFSGEAIIKDVQWEAALGLIAYAAVSAALACLLLYGFKHIDVNVGAIILATQLLFAAILGAIFLHEIPAPNEALGMLLIFAASIIAVINLHQLTPRSWRRPQPSTSSLH